MTGQPGKHELYITGSRPLARAVKLLQTLQQQPVSVWGELLTNTTPEGFSYLSTLAENEAGILIDIIKYLSSQLAEGCQLSITVGKVPLIKLFRFNNQVHFKLNTPLITALTVENFDQSIPEVLTTGLAISQEGEITMAMGLGVFFGYYKALLTRKGLKSEKVPDGVEPLGFEFSTLEG